MNSDGVRHFIPNGDNQCWIDWYGRSYQCSDIIKLSSNKSSSLTVGDTIVCGTGSDTIMYTASIDGVDDIKNFNPLQDYILIRHTSSDTIEILDSNGDSFILITSINQTYGGILVENVSPTTLSFHLIYKFTSDDNVSLEVSTQSTESILYINETAVSMQPGELRIVTSGFIYCISSVEYKVETYNGEAGFRILIYSNYINIWTFVSENLTVSGLLGTNDGSTSNLLVLRDGTVLPGTITAAMLYGAYANSWRITPNESLFTYNTGENTYTFNDPNFIAYYHSIKDYSSDAISIAKNLAIAAGYNPNSGLFNDILLEILAGGIDIQLAKSQLQSNLTSTNSTDTKTLEVLNPTSTATSTDLPTATSMGISTATSTGTSTATSTGTSTATSPGTSTLTTTSLQKTEQTITSVMVSSTTLKSHVRSLFMISWKTLLFCNILFNLLA